MLKIIVGYSINYASNKNRTFQIDVNELKCFLGVLLLSHYNEVSRRRMYWEKSQDTHSDLVLGAMRLNHFELIFSSIHFYDNRKLETHEKVFKIRTPHQKFYSIDESMVPYFGSHESKLFKRCKPICIGFKIWAGTLRLS